MDIGANIGLRSAAFARHRRLLAVCGLSVLLHVIAIAYVDAWIVPPAAPAATPGLAVRLAQAPAAPATPAAPPQEAARGTAQAQAAPAAAPVPVLPDSAEPSGSAAQPAAEPAPPDVGLPSPSAAHAGEPFQMPSRYRVTVPPSVTIAYALRDASGVAGEALLRWQTDGVQYRMALDGILGQIESEGGTDDAGIAPQRASYQIGAGSASVVFERERRTIVFESFARSAQDTPGSQDGATLLMQLAGIGLADPDQMQDAVDIYVGRADGAAVERFRVLGRVQLATPLGAMETVHLARGGSARLEVWLAPQHGWLPVQLRAMAPDGSTRTQVVVEIRWVP